MFLACLAFAPAFMGCAATQKHESTGEYVDDSVITTKVKAAILEEGSLKTLQINVKTFKGVVQLSGFVDSFEHVAKAGEVAGRVQGVQEVKNDLVAK
jgi:osmotically-inducible protein OsmY